MTAAGLIFFASVLDKYRSWAASRWSSTLARTFRPGGLTHLRPSRPRPARCKASTLRMTRRSTVPSSLAVTALALERFVVIPKIRYRQVDKPDQGRSPFLGKIDPDPIG